MQAKKQSLTLPSGWRWKGPRDSRTGRILPPWKCQVKGFELKKNAHQLALFMKVGSGKTTLLWNIMERHRLAGRLKKGIYLTENHLCDDVAEQAADCMYPGGLAVSVVQADDKNARIRAIHKATQDGATYLVMNYEALISLGQFILDFLGDDPYFVACDESTNIKTWHAMRTKAACRLGEEAKYRAILTGTPTIQGPQDIFGQYLFADSQIYGPRFVAFRIEFMRINQWKAIVGLQPAMHEIYYEKFHSIAYIPDPKDYNDIPPIVYEKITHDLNPEEKRAYKEMAAKMIVEMKKGEIRAANGMIKSLRLAQISSGFVGGMMKEDDEIVVAKFKQSSKLDALEKLVTSDQFKGTKFLVWAAWKQNVRDIVARLNKIGIKSVDYYGDTKDPRANENAFKNDPSVKAIVLTPDKGAKGLNLQGPNVKHAVFFTNTYRTIHREQAEGRNHRGAITHQCVVWDIVGKGTLDASIVRGHKNNVNFQDVLMRNPEKFFAGAY